MKKKTIKNYIAFTLTEMTMVLLIMSIIAAVSAPLVKHAVSDVVSSSVAESTGIWRKISSLSGIFYSSVGNGIVSIGTIPGAEPINYGFPAMIIQSNGGDKTNLVSQLGFYSTSISNSQRMSFDRYNNIAIGRNIKSNSDSDSLSYGKITIGSDIGNEKQLGSNQAILMGSTSLNTVYASVNHSILIGNDVANQQQTGPIGTEEKNIDDTINIGSYPSTLWAGKITYGYSSINIGNETARYTTKNIYNVNIGYHAANECDESENNVNIGSFAGGTLSGSDGNNSRSINIGKYAGAFKRQYRVSMGSSYSNVFVGQFAGSYLTRAYETNIIPKSDSYLRRNNIAIGLGSLASTWKYDHLEALDLMNNTCDDAATTKGCGEDKAFVSTKAMANDIAIGAFAGNNIHIMGYQYSNTVNNHNIILIGAYAGAKSVPFPNYMHVVTLSPGTPEAADNNTTYKGTIAIGPFASFSAGRARDNDSYRGSAEGFTNSISIGNYAGYESVQQGQIAIGNYAGAVSGEIVNGIGGFASDSKIFIGNFAGYESNSSAIGIGNYACSRLEGINNMCFGNFTYAMSLKDGYDMNTVWWAYDKARYRTTAVFYAGAGVGQQSDLILATKKIYTRDGTFLSITSDARSKRKINLVNYGIKDFRKFDIYNFTLKADKSHEKHIGVIAQEYRKAFPLGLDKNGKYYSVKLDWLYYSMINAVKDLDKLIQEFQVKFDEYINNFESIKARIDVLEKAVAQEKTNNENMRKELEQVNAKLNAKK